MSWLLLGAGDTDGGDMAAGWARAAGGGVAAGTAAFAATFARLDAGSGGGGGDVGAGSALGGKESLRLDRTSSCVGSAQLLRLGVASAGVIEEVAGVTESRPGVTESRPAVAAAAAAFCAGDFVLECSDACAINRRDGDGDACKQKGHVMRVGTSCVMIG